MEKVDNGLSSVSEKLGRARAELNDISAEFSSAGIRRMNERLKAASAELERCEEVIKKLIEKL